MNTADLQTLKGIAELDRQQSGGGFFTHNLAEHLGVTDRDAIVQLAKSVQRLVNGGYVLGQEITSMSSPHPEYLIRGVTALGMDELEASERPAGPPGGVVNFNLTGSNVGVLNTGQVVGDIHARLNLVQGDGAVEFKQALDKLAEVFEAAPELQASEKEEALALVKHVAEEAAKPPQQRNLFVLKTVVERLGLAAAGAASVEKIWATAHPILHHFFSI